MKKVIRLSKEEQTREPKFKVGDVITPAQFCQGFEDATIFKIENGRYHLTIPHGIATIPIHAEEAYVLKSEKQRK